MSLEQTKRRREAVGTIHDIVSAMRAIAAGRIQGAQRALASARRYEEIVLQSITRVTAPLGEVPMFQPAGRPSLLLVMTSEQPFCGAFNQNVLALADQRWNEMRQAGKVDLVMVGRRGLRQAAARGIVPLASEAAATSLVGLRDLVKRLASVVDRRFSGGQLGALHVVYSRYQSISEQVPTEERILPFDTSKSQRPTAPPAQDCYRYLSAPVLLAGLISQYAFISLYRIAADSFASEQASRLLAMDGATRSTERILKSLTDLERRERQGEITRQVLELIGARFAKD